MMRNYPVILGAAALLLSVPANAADYVLTLKGHAFSPPVLTVPANEKIKLTVKNLDATPAEFESGDLDREKVVGGNSSITVYIGPLDPGSYSYFNDFDRTVTGTIIAK